MQSSLPTRRMRRTQGLLGALLVTLLVALVLAGCGHTTASARTSQATPTITAPPATPSPLVTPTPTVPLVVSNAQVAQVVSFAYVRNNDVWVSLQKTQPRQVTHLGLDPQDPLGWQLLLVSRCVAIGGKQGPVRRAGSGVAALVFQRGGVAIPAALRGDMHLAGGALHRLRDRWQHALYAGATLRRAAAARRPDRAGTRNGCR